MHSKYLLFIFVLSGTLFGGCASSQNKSNKKVEQLMSEAIDQYKFEDYEKAKELVFKVIKLDPEMSDAYELLGRIYVAQKQDHKAISAYDKAILLDPMRIYSRLELAQIYFDSGLYDSCISKLEPVFKIAESEKQVVAEAGQLMANARFAREAVKNPVPFEPINMGSSINSKMEEYFPGLTVDESTFFFTRRDGSLHVYLQNEDLFYSTKVPKGWSQAKNMGGPVNTPENEGAFSTSADGQYLFFTSCSRPGGAGSCDIWISKLQGDRWGQPFNIGAPINTVHWETQPSLSSDGKMLFYASNRPDGHGGSDIWVSRFTDKGWTEPENLGLDINTGADEQFPFIHPDGKTLYFTSLGHPGMGKSDLFVTRWDQGKWSKPKNLGYPINTSGDEWNIIVDRNGNLAYYASDGQKSGMGGMDIYSFKLYDDVKPGRVSYVKGTVRDAQTKDPLRAKIELSDPSSGKLLFQSESNSKTGVFLATLRGNQDYILHVSAPGYIFYSQSFFLGEQTPDEPYQIEVLLEKISQGHKIVTRNIFFDVNKFDLKPESLAELNKIKEFLTKNPDISIEIGGHTDNSGNEKSNQILSENRAKSVYNHLVSQGIPASRLKYKGYGASQPISTNDKEGKALNRRTEFSIL